MKILILTGIYPPEIGGPSQYAYNLEQEFKKLGHEIRVAKFSEVRHLPSLIRHVVFFSKILRQLIWCDWCLALDTFSVAVPTVAAARLFGKKAIIRTGGDFLWESYIERTGDPILLRDFYGSTRYKWSTKEKVVFILTKWALTHAAKVIFSTVWQRAIWRVPYQLNINKTAIIENYYGPKQQSSLPKKQNFIWAGRPVKLKNLDILPKNFIFEIYDLSHAALMEEIRHCYAVIVPSLSDISPNLVLEAMAFNKPVIATQETGIKDRLGGAVIWIDPKNPVDVADKIAWLQDPENYRLQIEKVRQFTFTHNWSDIAKEFYEVARNW